MKTLSKTAASAKEIIFLICIHNYINKNKKKIRELKKTIFDV